MRGCGMRGAMRRDAGPSSVIRACGRSESRDLHLRYDGMPECETASGRRSVPRPISPHPHSFHSRHSPAHDSPRTAGRRRPAAARRRGADHPRVGAPRSRRAPSVERSAVDTDSDEPSRAGQMTPSHPGPPRSRGLFRHLKSGARGLRLEARSSHIAPPQIGQRGMPLASTLARGAPALAVAAGAATPLRARRPSARRGRRSGRRRPGRSARRPDHPAARGILALEVGGLRVPLSFPVVPHRSLALGTGRDRRSGVGRAGAGSSRLRLRVDRQN